MIRIPGVLAQVEVDPSTDGMPGADLIQQLLNWAQMLALWGSLGAILAGASCSGTGESGTTPATTVRSFCVLLTSRQPNNHSRSPRNSEARA